MYARCVKNVRLPGTAARLCRCSERCLKYCSDDSRLPGMSGCPICPAARYVRLPGTMPGCPELCPAARKYARLSGMPGCPAVRLPGTMPGCPEICSEICSAARYARLSGTMPGCPELCPECPAPRHRHYSYAWTPNASLQRRRWRPPPIGTSAGTPRRPKIAPNSGAAPAASAARQCWAA